MNIQQSEDITELIKALHAFHGKVENIEKSAEGGGSTFKYNYAPLDVILPAIKEPLQESNLTFTQFPVNEYELTTRIMHTSGQWMEGTYRMEPSKKDPQGQGSAITYQKRYALVAILGLNVDDDDDGSAASQTIKKPEVENKVEPSITHSEETYECPKCKGEAKVISGISKQGKPYKGLKCNTDKDHFFFSNSEEYKQSVEQQGETISVENIPF